MQCYFRAGYKNRLQLGKILVLCKLTHTFLCHHCTTSFWEHILNNSYQNWSSDPTTLSGSSCLCVVHFLQWNDFNLEYLSQIYLSSKTQMPFNSCIIKSKELNWELKCSCPLPKSTPATPLFQHVAAARALPGTEAMQGSQTEHPLALYKGSDP